MGKNFLSINTGEDITEENTDIFEYTIYFLYASEKKHIHEKGKL